uniref:Glucagon like peptide 2 receptor n=1 Tax=Pavo cristatus TaxID=9049 RepID=A0A8C9G2T3_PAVCR
LFLSGKGDVFYSQAKGSLLEKTTTGWNKYKQECLKMLQESTLGTGIHCNGTFDQFVCWPYSTPGKVSVPCPSYLPWLENGIPWIWGYLSSPLFLFTFPQYSCVCPGTELDLNQKCLWA